MTIQIFLPNDFMSSIVKKNMNPDFDKNIVDTLNKHAPKKITVVRGNQKPHVNNS